MESSFSCPPAPAQPRHLAHRDLDHRAEQRAQVQRRQQRTGNQTDDLNPASLETVTALIDPLLTDTPPGIKGATATNQTKEATMETGLKTKVPPFIEIGEVIRISTDGGGYLSRA